APAGEGRSGVEHRVEGLSFVGRNFVFAGLIGLALFNSLFGLSYITLLPVFADRYFAAGSAGYGLLSAAHGSGALMGTLTLATIAHRIARPRTALLTCAARQCVILMLLSHGTGMGLALQVLVLVGIRNTFYLTQVNTLVQQTVPDKLRGRVMSLYALCWNLVPLGGLLAGALAAAASARVAVLVG